MAARREQTVVVDPEAKRLYGLNASAGAIWHALDGARSADALAELFEGGDEAAERRRVVEEFLTGLEREGLVDRAVASSQEERVGDASEPRATWAPPEVSWREEIQTFARACAFHPGQNVVCNVNPRS